MESRSGARSGAGLGLRLGAAIGGAVLRQVPAQPVPRFLRPGKPPLTLPRAFQPHPALTVLRPPAAVGPGDITWGLIDEGVELVGQLLRRSGIPSERIELGQLERGLGQARGPATHPQPPTALTVRVQAAGGTMCSS